MAADWVTIVFANPFMLVVSIAPTRYSYRLIKRYREFVVSIPSVDIVNNV